MQLTCTEREVSAVALDDSRHAQLAGTLASVRARIADACARAGRDPEAITLVAVTKTYPAADVVILAELGVTDVGESRDQEASAKVGEVAQLLPEAMLRWHFVGRLQSRKARSVASYAYSVHSLDRTELVGRLADGVARAGRAPLEVFLQVSLDDDPERGGVRSDDLTALADAVEQRKELLLRGVMAVAPLGADPERAFADLAAVSQRLQRDHPQASAISAGMSGDLDAALSNGATHVRIGSALLGERDPVVR
jgi:pyridoxal phosphate enzyme (YggS family)